MADKSRRSVLYDKKKNTDGEAQESQPEFDPIHHLDKMKEAADTMLEHHSQLMDYHRSVDDIVKDGSNPNANSRFRSSSARDKDTD